MKNKKTIRTNIREREFLFYLIILASLILMLPHLIRFLSGNSTLIGSQAYYHIRVAENLLSGNTITDSLVYGGRNFVFLPYHFLLAVVGSLTGMEVASKLLPFASGILSLIVFYLILKNLRISPIKRFVVSLLLIVSPPFIYLFTVSTPNCLSVFLSLLGLYLFLRESRLMFVLSAVCFILVSLSGIFNMVLIAAMLLFLLVWNEKNRKKTFISVLVMLGFYFVHTAGFYYNFEFPVTNLLKVLVSDLGAKAGFSPFAMILAVIGLFSSWKEKGRYYPLYFILLFLTASTPYIGGETSLYTVFIVALFASMGLKSLYKLEWKFVSVRNLSFILIGCGLLFSTASYLNRMPFSMPNNNIAGGLGWLKENSGKGSVVLSHYSRGYWVESMAERPVLIDGFSDSISNFDRKYADANKIFYSIDLDDTAGLLRKYNISYILIDEEMKQDILWSKEKEGLLYLLRNNRTFKKVYSSSKADIWKAEVY